MLPDLTLPVSWAAVLENLRWVFTAPSFATFSALVTGLVANTGAGTVTGMLTGVGLARSMSHDRAHAFFSRASWSVDTLGLYLSRLIVRSVLPEGAGLTVAIDDTLFKKRGKKVFGAAWQHDGAARGRDGLGFGCCFVVAGIIVELPFLTRPVCLPVAVRLWRKDGPSKVEIAAALVKLIAWWHRDATIDVVADAAHHGPALRALPARITWTTRLPACAVLYDLAPPPTGKRGRPRLKGDRLGTPAELAETATFTTTQVQRYRRDQMLVVRLVSHPGSSRRAHPRRRRRHRLRPGPGHHRSHHRRPGVGVQVRVEVVHRGAPPVVRVKSVCFFIVWSCSRCQCRRRVRGPGLQRGVERPGILPGVTRADRRIPRPKRPGGRPVYESGSLP